MQSLNLTNYLLTLALILAAVFTVVHLMQRGLARLTERPVIVKVKPRL